MEEGSLLQHVLEEILSRRDRQAHEVSSFWTENVLLIDVFCCRRNNVNNKKKADDVNHEHYIESLLLRLAQLANELNNFVQRFQFPWHVGGDGIVFGIHTTSSIPHLRGACYYGANVLDEWMAIAMMKQWSQTTKSTATQETEEEIAIQCWDVQDGHVVLIQTADVLPEWVDRIGPPACRYRCWLIQGQVTLIAPSNSNDAATASKTLNLPTAFQILSEWCCCQKNNSSFSVTFPDQRVTRPSAVQQSLQQFLSPLEQDLLTMSFKSDDGDSHDDTSTTSSSTPTISNAFIPFARHRQRTALLVPRSVALFLQQRPDLINTLVIMFQQLVESTLSPADITKDNKSRKTHHGANDDWIWIKISMSKTNYAMLRTIETPLWPLETPSNIPPAYQTEQTRKLQLLLSQNKRYQHVQYALQLGVRLTAGLDYMLFLYQQQKGHPLPPLVATPTTLLQRRIQQYWRWIYRACGGRGGGEHWLKRVHDDTTLDQVRNCPVYDPELLLVPPPHSSTNSTSTSTTSILNNNSFNPCPLTRPGISLALQIVTLLDQQASTPQHQKPNTEHSIGVVPRPEEIDDEESWMVLSETEGQTFEGAYNNYRRSPVPQEQEPSSETNSPTLSGLSGVDQDLDVMLDSFHSFMTKPSEVEGVHTRATSMGGSDKETSKDGFIQPRIFLNLLHAVLSSSRAEDLDLPCIDTTTALPSTTGKPSAFDPYFSDDDYDIMAGSSDDGDEYETIDRNRANLREIMAAMDEELQGTNVAMDYDHLISPGNEGDENQHIQQQTHVLSNLLKSLDAAEGGSGPVQNIMKEMGINPPDMPPSL